MALKHPISRLTPMTRERVSKYLVYDALEGRFRSKHTGRLVGHMNGGYPSVAVHGYKVMTARLVWLMETGTYPSRLKYHDGNPENTRFSNLELREPISTTDPMFDYWRDSVATPLDLVKAAVSYMKWRAAEGIAPLEPEVHSQMEADTAARELAIEERLWCETASFDKIDDKDAFEAWREARRIARLLG